ncbi:MAG: hypothetical protein ABF780_05680 [Bifidobacterium aquikefiri]|uniref:Phage tail tape measure protein n=1 Tax=Bifidobacterium aquikefiri TaxID=1653207 RepID=A0A261G289_9BIFI|nr:hypothetical protein [Bifidobacterium aquikefiri]OZG65547.1 phage tail tape measure protein [Bifidobacterium aquikefiri]
MSDTATEVGSIKGLLKLDISDYMQGIEKAKAAEDDLKSGNDDIHIDANVAEAVEKIDDVTERKDRLTSGSSDMRITADVDQAVGKIDMLDEKVDETSAKTSDIKVDADTSEAVAKIDEVAEQASQLSDHDRDVKIQASVDQAIAKIEELSAQADTVSDKKHSIQVDADTGKAVSEIQVVTLAEQELNESTSRLKAAYEQLDAVQSEGTASQSALMVADAAATRMEQEHAQAAEHLRDVLAENNVALAESATAEAAYVTAAREQSAMGSKLGTTVDINTSAEKMNTSATRSNSDAKMSNTSAMEADSSATSENTAAKSSNAAANDRNTESSHALRGALLTIAPALIPVVGAAAGAGAALVAMAGTGILAIRGIKTAMDEGTATGKQYKQDLNSLSNNMNALSNTGAVEFLQGFNSITNQVNSKMPLLSTYTATFSRDLGTISGNAVEGLLGLFQQLEPVLLSVDQGIVKASEGFAQWGTGSGAKDFVTYLMDELPAVETALGSLFTAAGHVVQAFNPWGNAVLTAITDVSNVISSIPVDDLSGLVTGAMAAYTAFKTFQLITPIVKGVSGALDAIGTGASLTSLITPVGATVAAIGLLAAAFAAFSAKDQEATQATEDYTQALTTSKGVIDSTVTSTVAKRLQDEQAYDMADKLGVSYSTLNSAIEGQGDSYSSLSKQLKSTISDYSKYAGTVDAAKAPTAEQYSTAQKLLKVLQSEHSGFTSSASAQKQLAEATGDATSSIDDQAQILGVSEGKWVALSNAETSATDAAKLYKDALDALNGKSQALAQATNTATTQFDTMASTWQQDIKQVGKAQATSMDSSTEYGAKNREMILQTVQAEQSKAAAIYASEGKTEKAYKDSAQAQEQARQKILETAKANGLNTDQVSAYLDQIFQIPKVDTTRIYVDTSDATLGLKDLKVKTASLSADSKTITITGNNKDALEKIAAVVGAKINPKTGTLTMNKAQYDAALALANGAKINPKTGQLLGNNTPLFTKLAQANGWTINPKTGLIKGDDGNFLSVKNYVDATKIAPKTVDINANLSGWQAAVAQIKGAAIQTSVGVSVSMANALKGGYTGGMFDGSTFKQGYANGGQFSGAVSGPSSPIKDNVILSNARLNPGEHVLTKSDVDAMGGQRAVYAFRSSLHSSSGYQNGGSTSKNDNAGGTPYLPDTINLIDVDGSLLAKVKTIAQQQVARHNTSMVRGLING